MSATARAAFDANSAERTASAASGGASQEPDEHERPQVDVPRAEERGGILGCARTSA
jgi:hypothetical protein